VATTKRRRNSLNKVLYLIFFCSNSSTLMPPPTRGGSSESDDRAAFPMRWMKIKFRWRISFWSKIRFFPSSICGGVEDGRPCPLFQRERQWRRSNDTKIIAPLSATKDCRPTHLASRGPFQSPDLDTGVSEFETAALHCPASSAMTEDLVACSNFFVWSLL
jgi:hypothetical protein